MARPSERQQIFAFGRILEKVTSFFFDESGPQAHSLFLCGASTSDPESMRSKVAQSIRTVRSKFNYQIYFPEHLFEELIRGHGADSLLDLENILAESVDAIVIIAESPGTIAELGAFANHEGLREKLLVFIDSKYRSHRSFINLGPVRLLKKHRSDSVQFVDFGALNSVGVISEIARKFVRDVRRTIPQNRSLENPILSLHPILAFIGITEPVLKRSIADTVKLLARDNHKGEISLQTALNYLNNRGLIRNYSNELSLTKDGRYYLSRSFSKKQTNSKLEKLLLEQRVFFLNKCLRNHVCLSLRAQ